MRAPTTPPAPVTSGGARFPAAGRPEGRPESPPAGAKEQRGTGVFLPLSLMSSGPAAAAPAAAGAASGTQGRAPAARLAQKAQRRRSSPTAAGLWRDGSPPAAHEPQPRRSGSPPVAGDSSGSSSEACFGASPFAAYSASAFAARGAEGCLDASGASAAWGEAPPPAQLLPMFSAAEGQADGSPAASGSFAVGAFAAVPSLAAVGLDSFDMQVPAGAAAAYVPPPPGAALAPAVAEAQLLDANVAAMLAVAASLAPCASSGAALFGGCGAGDALPVDAGGLQCLSLPEPQLSAPTALGSEEGWLAAVDSEISRLTSIRDDIAGKRAALATPALAASTQLQLQPSLVAAAATGPWLARACNQEVDLFGAAASAGSLLGAPVHINAGDMFLPWQQQQQVPQAGVPFALC